MQIEVNGVKIDTDKPIYIYGYSYVGPYSRPNRGPWFPFNREDKGLDSSRKPSAKRYYIGEVVFQAGLRRFWEVPNTSNTVARVGVVGERGPINDLSKLYFGATPAAAKKAFLEAQICA